MASEISVTGTLTDSTINVSIAPGTQTIDQTNKRKISNVQNIPTTAAGTALTLGAVTVPGWSFFKNLDATNYVEIGDDNAGTFIPVIRVDPGKYVGPLKLGTTAPLARANAAAVDLDYTILDT
jgi:hypothetical protein